MSIHSRQAVRDVLSILRAHPGFGTAVLHWFTGTAAEIKVASDIGCWFSIGPATFNSASGKALAKKLPRDRVVPESDGPFAQVNGVTVMPWSSDQTVELLAQAWDLPADEVKLSLEFNSRQLLSLIMKPRDNIFQSTSLIISHFFNNLRCSATSLRHNESFSSPHFHVTA